VKFHGGLSYVALVGLRSTYGASVGTSAAIDASCSIDNEFAITFGDRFDGAPLGTRAAVDAIVRDFESHIEHLLCFTMVT
jgi:hypothetical protein